MINFEPIEIAKDLVEKYKNKDFNEADTRHKIIDEVIHNILSWPKQMVRCETYHSPDYSDYMLIKNENVKLFIDAKKESHYYELPNCLNSDKNSEFISVEVLFGNGKSNIAKAMTQVREYCDSEACEFACITNGHAWIFFKALSIGKPWKKYKAYVIKNLNFFVENHIEALNNFCYKSIIEDNSLNKLFSSPEKLRNIYYPQERIIAYDEPVKNNVLSISLKPIVDKYFGDFNTENIEFFNKCYISDREYTNAYKGMREKLKDSLTPYFKDHGVRDFIDDNKGGDFGSQIEKYLKKMEREEVLILFGSKGAGKSTFIKKLFFANRPEYLKNNAITIIVDMLKVPLKTENLSSEIWSFIVNKLDVDNLLKSNRTELIEKLYKDKYETALIQELYGFDEKSDIFNDKLNTLVSEWKKDLVYTSISLRNYWIKKSKGIVIVIDNTDQFEEAMQDECFTIAQEISNKLHCLSIISMREERYYKSSIHGTLDAYQNSGFHITAPSPEKVFLKRIEYILNHLEDEKKCNELLLFKNITKKEKLHKIFKILENEFRRKPNSDLNEFLTACAHSNIRIALELFRNLTLSGYFNVNEMIEADNLWKLKINHVLKPIMVPDRFFYNEAKSYVANIFQIREFSANSHFTSLRILKYLSNNLNINESKYHSLNELKDYFSEKFNNIDDLKQSLDVLLKFRLVETSNMIDSYSDDIDELKITTYGYFLLKSIIKEFTYLELVSSSCGLFSEKFCNEIYEYSNDDFRLTQKLTHEKTKEEKNPIIIERINKRILKVESFLNYLREEEKREKEKFSLTDNDILISDIYDNFNIQKIDVLKGAKRNYGEKTTDDNTFKKTKNGFTVLD